MQSLHEAEESIKQLYLNYITLQSNDNNTNQVVVNDVLDVLIQFDNDTIVIMFYQKKVTVTQHTANATWIVGYSGLFFVVNSTTVMAAGDCSGTQLCHRNTNVTEQTAF